MKKNKRKKIIIISLICILLIVISLIIYLIQNKDVSRKLTKEKEVVSKIDKFDYYLESNASKYYKETYKELESILSKEEVDYLEYSKLVSKLFLADVFTLDNKNISSDIGGIQFIYPNFENDFRKIVQTTLYSSIETNFDGNRSQELPIVANIDVINVEEGTFNYNSTNITSYNVDANVTYEKDLGYQTKFSLVLIKEKEKLYIAKLS